MEIEDIKKYLCWPIYIFLTVAVVLIIIAFLLGAYYGGIVHALVALIFNIVVTIVLVILLAIVCYIGDNLINFKIGAFGVGTILSLLSVIVYVLSILSTNILGYRLVR